eukprot:PhM_4_TR2499/c0_g1_i1/m.89735
MSSLKSREIAVLAFLVVLSILMSILACTVVSDANAFPIMVLALYIFSPLPLFLCGQQRSESVFDEGGVDLVNVSHFLFGAFAAAGPACLVVLSHLGKISVGAALLSASSFVFLCITVGAALHFKNKADDDLF